MTNQLPALPAYLKDVQNWGLIAAGKKGLGAVREAHLSIANQDFTLIEANGQESKAGGFDEKFGGRFFHAVIVAVSDVQSRIFYNSVWQPGQEYYNPPACYSEDGITPAQDAPEIQHPTCARCPQAAWGSKQGIGGGKAQACQDGKRIVIYVPKKGFYKFRITPGSFKSFQSYINTLEVQGVEPQYFMTRFQFVSQGVLAFIADNFITEEIKNAYNKPDEIRRLLKPPSGSLQVTAAIFEQPAQIVAPTSSVATYASLHATQPTPAYEHVPTYTTTQSAPALTRKSRATKAEMEARRAGVSAPQAEVPPQVDGVEPLAQTIINRVENTASPVFGQATPGIVKDPALKAALAAAFSA